VKDAVARLKAPIGKIPNIMATPAPDVEVIEFTPMGPVLAVRPYTHTEHYWRVYFDQPGDHRHVRIGGVPGAGDALPLPSIGVVVDPYGRRG